MLLSSSTGVNLHGAAHAIAILNAVRAEPLRIRGFTLDVYELSAAFDWGEPDPDHGPTLYWFEDWQGIQARMPTPEIILQTGPAIDVQRQMAYKIGLVAYFRLITETERADWANYCPFRPGEAFASAYVQAYYPYLGPAGDPDVMAKMRGILGVQAPGY